MTDTISSASLYNAILTGAAQTRERQDELNRINVFPVVDNDTGSNLAHTMGSIMNQARPHEDVRNTLREIARSALVGARGNSGAIFSQYFNGLYLASQEKSHLTLHELAACFQEAYLKAYQAIEKPVEGTVITVMRAWAAGFRDSLETRKTLPELLEGSLSQARQSLDETTSTLRELKKLGIVDAGALGFYYFMDGFVQALLGKKSHIQRRAETPVTADLAEDIHQFGAASDIQYRYCTEVLLESDRLDLEGIRADMKPLGDCLLVTSAENLARVHLHTSEPWEAVRRAAARGRILEQKADDMVFQLLLSGAPEKKTALVTDSIADLPPEYLHQHQVFQIPLNILVDGVNYLDKRTIDSAFLNAHLDKASSAQLNTEQIHAFIKPILRRFESVLILAVSSEMSGTYSRLREALAALGEDSARTALIDTKVNSGAQGLLVRRAVGLIERGLPFGEIVADIEAAKRRARILVSVVDIEPMARSGRVSERIGDLLIRLRFKPLVTINAEGKGTIRGVAFSDRKNWKLLLKMLRGRPMEDYVIVHADAAERAEALRQEMVRLTGKEPLYVTTISSVVTLFAGRGSVAVAWMEKEPA